MWIMNRNKAMRFLWMLIVECWTSKGQKNFYGRLYEEIDRLID